MSAAAAGGDAPSPTPKRQRTAPASIPAALNEALELVDSLAEEGHVNTHAHNQIAQALKRVHDVDASNQNKAVRNAVLKVAAECGFILGPVMCCEVGENLGIFEPKFMRKLFRQRLGIETKPCAKFATDWIEEILEFYVQAPSESETPDDLDMPRDMILMLLQTTPHGMSITDDLIAHLRKAKIAPRTLVYTNADERHTIEYGYTNGWLEELLDCAPEMIEWAAPASDTSEWAAETRALLDDNGASA